MVGVTLLALVRLGVCQTEVQAQDPLTIGLIGLGGKALIGSILDDAEERAKNVVDRARQSGDIVVAHAGAELELTVANLRLMFAEMRDHTFDQLTKSQQRLFLDLNRTLEGIDDLGKPRELAELAVLDLEEFVRNVKFAFVGSIGPEFYVSSIRGTTLVEQDHDYEVRVAGLGFGYKVEGQDTVSVVEVEVGGKPLSFASIRQIENQLVSVRIPAKKLTDKFKDDAITTVPFKFRVIIAKKSKTRNEPKQYEVIVPLVLMPRFPGSVTIEEFVEEKVWSNSQRKTIVLSRNSKSELELREEKFTVPQDQRIVKVEYECPDSKAGFAYSVRLDGVAGRNYEPDYDVLDAGKTALVRRKITSYPMDCFYHVTYETQTAVSKSVKSDSIRLKYDLPIEVLLAANNRKGNFRVTGTLFDGRKIMLNSETAATDKSCPLRLVGIGDAGDRVRATFVLKPVP